MLFCLDCIAKWHFWQKNFSRKEDFRFSLSFIQQDWHFFTKFFVFDTFYGIKVGGTQSSFNLSLTMPCLLFCAEKKDYTVTVHGTPQNCLVEENEKGSAHCSFTVSPGRLTDGGGGPFVTKAFRQVTGIFCQFSVWKVSVLHVATQYELRFLLSLCWWSGWKAVCSLEHLFMQKVTKNVWNLWFVVLGFLNAIL